MKAQFYQRQIEELLTMVERGQGNESDAMTHLNANDYRCEKRHLREKAMFRRLPLLIGHSSEIPAKGDYIVREIDGRSFLLVRDDQGHARAFFNYCQHRGTKLVQDASGCKKRFTCPYHAWTYNVRGDLVGVPRADLFPGLDKSTKGLKSVDLDEAYGFLWINQERGGDAPLSTYLGGLVPELQALGLQDHHVYFDKTRQLNANWKLPIFAFLESYHIATLHRSSIAEFFVENIASSEQFGPHIRSFVPRKNISELAHQDLSNINMSEYITPTNIVFPNMCMIAHPTSYTIITTFPGDTPGQSTWRHMLLVPELPKDDAEKAHFDKTVAVLDGITYEQEDFWVSEQVQEGINAGAIDEMVLAKNELMLKVFSDSVELFSDSVE